MAQPTAEPWSEDSFLDCECPWCRAELSFECSLAGTAQSCPECLEPLVVPVTPGSVAGPLPLPIPTRRLLLRRFQPDDWKPLLEIMSNEALLRYEETAPMDEEAVLRWLEQDRAARLTQPGQSLCLALVLASAGNVLGWASLSYHDAGHEQATFNVMVHPAFQRQGYATEAVGGLLHFGFAGIRLHRMTASCDSRNTAARRLLAKAGLRCEGEFVEDRWVNGAWVSTVWFALLRKEYEQWPQA